jgi:hypothetical protein
MHRGRGDPRGRPGRFLGFEQPFGSGIYKVLLDTGEVKRSQTVVFDDAPHVPPPVVLPETAPTKVSDVCDESDSEDEDGEQGGVGGLLRSSPSLASTLTNGPSVLGRIGVTASSPLNA